ncbi:MAG: uncharacterized protein QOJ00_2550 [Actinomycetota bacterium]|jgi:predicted enzyme related to lactoylglutathione lyase
MAKRTSHPAGTPSWLDIGSPDIDGTFAFYGPLFGWERVDLGPDAGGYGMAAIEGDTVAGVGPAQQPGPPFWTTYIATDDVQATTKKVEAAGGAVIVGPTDVFDQGKFAVYADPNGAVFSVWESGDNIGAYRVNENGTLCWNELNTWNLDAAKPFYAEVFGWDISDNPEYGEFSVGGRVVGGMMPLSTERVPQETPEHWLVYFAVDDINAAVAKINELGGTVMMEPFEAGGVGLMTVNKDPQGAVFATIQMNEPGD